ncbi:MAG: hypothetical protein AAF503_00870 [Pseudomonadota bacterium]
MVEFSDRDEIEDWLKTRDIDEFTLFGVRAVLRIAPLLAADGRDDAPANLLLPCFRAMSVAWFAGIWLKEADDTNEIATAAALSAGSAADAAGARAAATAYAAASAPNAGDVLAAVRSSHGADHLSANAFAAFGADATALEQGIGLMGLSQRPLWNGVQAPTEITQMWEELKQRLPPDQDWDVWTTWYEARLAGTPANMELEKARVLIPDEDWEQGPAHVNAIIKRLIAEHSPSLKDLAARRIAQQPKAAAVSAEVERARLEERLKEVRANLPNEPEALEKAREEIAQLEAMKAALETIAEEASALPDPATVEQAAEAAAATVDLAAQLKSWVNQYLTKERANTVADGLVVAGLVAFLIWCGMPAWMASSFMVASFAEKRVWKRIKALKGKD